VFLLLEEKFNSLPTDITKVVRKFVDVKIDMRLNNSGR
jgi:hypothetical protein